MRSAIPLRLDPDGPAPLYHQIAQAIRWRIGTGALAVGAPLPPARQAAEDWGVNFHTVRQAYAELVRQGLVESRAGSGTRVISSKGAPSELRGFLEKIVDEGQRRFGLSGAELAGLLGRGETTAGPVSQVLLVECNAHQCTDLAGQVEARWEVEATPWELDRTGALPDLPILSTYFHFNEIRARWPERIATMHFGALELDPEVITRIGRSLGGKHGAPLILAEQDATTGREMAADCSARLPGHPAITVTTRAPAAVLRRLRRGQLLLVAPRVWDRQGAEVREHPAVVEVRHIFQPGHLESIGLALGLVRRGAAKALG